MMKGKQRCKILKEIRRSIAENNGIEFAVSECKHQGDCPGTCPKCEAEVRYLERELERRRKLGMAVTVAGIAVMMTASSVACDTPDNPDQIVVTTPNEKGPSDVDGMMIVEPPKDITTEAPDVDGEMAPLPEDTGSKDSKNVEIVGEVPEDWMGDIAVP